MRRLVPVLMFACSVDGSTDVGTDTEAQVSTFRCDVKGDDFVPDARVVRWPYVTSVTGTTATVQFGLPAGTTTGAVEWGTSDAFGTTTPGVAAEVDALVDPIALHAVTLTGLQPDTSYCYRVVLDGADLTGPLAIHTAAPTDTEKPIRFVVLGDYGSGLGPAQRVLDQILAREGEYDFWLTVGDNAYTDGTYKEWELNVFQFYKQLLRRVPYFPTPGNHDYGDGSLQPMFDNLALPKMAYRDEDQERYYAFDWGAAHFTMLDSERAVYQITPDEHDDQMDFARDDLAANQDRPWRIAVWHHPPLLTQPGRYAEIGVTTQLVPAVEEGNVDLVLAGHAHIYERYENILQRQKVAKGVTYVTTGGGGAGLYEVTPDGGDHPDLPLREFGASVWQFLLIEVDRCHLKGRAIDLDGNEFDTFQLDRC